LSLNAYKAFIVLIVVHGWLLLAVTNKKAPPQQLDTFASSY